jgi:hypothetical protein
MDPESLIRRARIHFGSPHRVRSKVDPTSFVTSTSTLMANPNDKKTLCEYSSPSADQVPTGLEINTRKGNFEIKTGLITMVQSIPLCGKPNDDANTTHLQQFLELRGTFTIRGVEEDAIHRRLFPFSLLNLDSSVVILTGVLCFEGSGSRPQSTPVRPVLLTGQTGTHQSDWSDPSVRPT